MPDKKLTDNEIKKALKEVLKLMLCDGDLQRSSTISNALDYINRLEAEKQDLEIELKAMRGASNSYKAKNERLNNLCTEQNTEISRLKKVSAKHSPILLPLAKIPQIMYYFIINNFPLEEYK